MPKHPIQQAIEDSVKQDTPEEPDATEESKKPKLARRAAGPKISRAPRVEVLKMKDIANSGLLRILIYGGPGVGKTLAASTAYGVGGLGKILWIGFEGGEFTVGHLSEADVALVSGYDQMWEIIGALRTRYEGWDYDTIIIDGLESLYQRQLRFQLRTLTINRFDAAVPAQQDYLVSTTRMRTLLDGMLKTSVNWIITTQMRTWVDASKLQHVKPRMPGQLADEVAQYFDTVIYLYTKAIGQKVQYFAQFAPFGRIYAKVRAPGGKSPLPPVLDVTDKETLSIVYDAVMGGGPVGSTVTLSKQDEVSGESAPAAVLA